MVGLTMLLNMLCIKPMYYAKYKTHVLFHCGACAAMCYLNQGENYFSEDEVDLKSINLKKL